MPSNKNVPNYRKNVEEYFGELLPHAANGNTKKKKNIEEYFGSEIDLNKPAFNKADAKLRGLINPSSREDGNFLIHFRIISFHVFDGI